MIHKIYKLSCKICNHFYIGQTSASILDRYSQHRQRANKGTKTRLYSHMRSCGIRNFKIKTLWKINTTDKELVNDMEMFYIRMLDPKLNVCVRKVRQIGMKKYLRQYREKMRDGQNHRCSLCDINCVARIHLINHFTTQKHQKKEAELLEDMDRLSNI